jgi:hypothetical protein
MGGTPSPHSFFCKIVIPLGIGVIGLANSSGRRTYRQILLNKRLMDADWGTDGSGEGSMEGRVMTNATSHRAHRLSELDDGGWFLSAVL